MKTLTIVLLLLFSKTIMAFDGANYIYGSVTSKTSKEPLAAAVVVIVKPQMGVITDTNGWYKLSIPDSLSGRKIEVEFRYVGYLNLIKVVCFKGRSKNLNVELEEKNIKLKNILPIVNNKDKKVKKRRKT